MRGAKPLALPNFDAALRLARLGHEVCVVERHAFPRPHVGESLTPGVWPLLDALGVVESVRRGGFLPALEALVRWEDATGRRVHGRAGATGLLVDRGRFDALLLGAAASAGVRVLQPAVAQRPERTSGGWVLPVLHEGQQLLVSGLGLLVVTVKFPGGIASAGPWLRSLLSPRRDRPAARRDTDDVEVFAIELDPVASGASDPRARGAGR